MSNNDIDVGALSEAINDKMDRDLNNRSDDSGLRKLVESYVDGASWYKIFDEIQSDGTVKKWCEQGDSFGSAYTVYTSKTINLLKQFADTNYCIIYNTASTNQAYVAAITDKTTNSFTLANTVNYNGYATWYTCGYIS